MVVSVRHHHTAALPKGKELPVAIE